MRRVIRAAAGEDFTLDLTFDDGSVKRFDMKPYLDFPVYRRLKNPEYFNHLRIRYGTVQWADEQDMSPDTLYLEGVERGDKAVV